MEWNRKFYFGWPLPSWGGAVYEVDPKAVELSSVVQLPDGTELQLAKDDNDSLLVSETSTRNRSKAVVFQATKVFDTDEESPTFEGDWDTLLWKLNAAAAVNTLFTVYLTSKEFQRLAANSGTEFEVLKQKMSPRAVLLVNLLEGDSDDQPSVTLYRTGRCP